MFVHRRRIFSTSSIHNSSLTAQCAAFDTNNLVKRLKNSGLSYDASKTLSTLLNEALRPAVQDISNASVSRLHLEKDISTHNVDLGKLKGEFQLQQSQAYQRNKLVMEQFLRELRTARQRSRENLGAIRSEMRLEVNLERGRQRDASASALLKFQDVQRRADGEGGNAYAALAKLRHEIFYSLTGFLFTSVAALFGFLRLLS